MKKAEKDLVSYDDLSSHDLDYVIQDKLNNENNEENPTVTRLVVPELT